MSSVTDGFVLRSPRTAPSNANTTADATNGVSRAVKNLPASYALPGTFVEAAGDQYRSAVLQNPSQTDTQEYLLWAANSSSLSLLETPDWTITAEDPSKSATIPTGTLSVTDLAFATTRTDGTSRLVVIDAGGRGLAEVRLLKIVRGDTKAEIEVGPDAITDFESQDADAGLVTLGTTTLTALGGGVSKLRGDTITQVDYIVARARFWWTRNDANLTRFGWNGKTQRWEPFKGSAPVDAGPIIPEETITLTPRPSRFEIGDTLPGNPSNPDSFALLRVGTEPDANTVIPTVLVVADTDVATHTFGSEDGVIGVTNGIIRWNPTFESTYVGVTVWYSFEEFQEDSNGAVGSLLDANDRPLFIAPIPEMTDQAFIRIGFRRYLIPIAAVDDNDLDNNIFPNEGEVGWSRSTGKLKFNQVDIDKSNPDAIGFDLQYLGAQVYYDGVSLTTTPLKTKEPIALVGDSGLPETVGSSNDLYIPESSPLPTPGTSGVLLVPDDTGTIPNNTAIPTYRSNSSGLVRRLLGVGDTFLFGPSGAFENLRVVDQESDLPDFPFAIRRGRAWVARELGTAGSRVSIGLKDRAKFGGEQLYFLQADVQPAIFAEKARMYSREKGPFTLEGTEKLIFHIDGTDYVWEASTLGAGTFEAATVAADIDSILSTGQCTALNDRLILEATNVDTGIVEIGFGELSGVPNGDFENRNFTGAAVFGFLPGWRIDNPSVNENFLPDQGTSLGVWRSPVNKDRSNETPDIQARSRFNNELFSENIIANQQFTLTAPPLQDVAGFDDNRFFVIVDGLNIKQIDNLQEALYDFGNDRILWLEEGSISANIETISPALFLGNVAVVEDTLHPAVGTGFGLSLAPTGGAYTDLVLNQDYIVPQNGGPGQAVLINKIGPLISKGSSGTISAVGTTFTDLNASFITSGVSAGYRLKILSGDKNKGSYKVDSVTSETTLEVSSEVPFQESDTFISWELYQGVPTSVYDPAILADTQYTEFNHLPEEPFKIRLLHSVGSLPNNSTEQAANRLVAIATEALNFGRVISARFGLPFGTAEASITPLTSTEIGVMANDSLSIPDVTDPHFTNANFSIQVGTKQYTIGVDLTGVASFSPSLPGDEIEFINSGPNLGALKFGDITLDTLESSIVYYFQEFLNPSVLTAGNAEIQSSTGELNFSDADMASFGGQTTYFVEQMITEQRFDVVLSPLNGTVYFKRPLREFQIVEVSYFPANIDGTLASTTPITEFLPLFVRQEVCTSVSTKTYAYNSTNRTIDTNVEPVVWVGPNRQNFGNVTTATFDLTQSTVDFTSDVEPSDVVRINYAVYEAFGGEESYTTSTIPVFRPPFYLNADTNAFILDTDRTTDLIPGKLLRIGATPLYIESATYNSADDTTLVVFFPPTTQEIGSRAPGNDLLSLLSNVPVTTLVNGTPTTADPGFMLPLNASYEPVDAGMISINFFGDVTEFAVAGHLIDLNGYPFLIAAASLALNGETTKVDLTTPLPKGFNSVTDPVKISVRPIYPPTPSEFLGVGPFVASEGHELVLYGELDSLGTPQPGRTLVENVHYKIDPSSGAVSFIAPTQEGLQPNQSLELSYNRQIILKPFVFNGVTIFPRYRAKYSYITTPSESNGLLGNVLLATYTYRNPDSFYYRAVPLISYLGEVAQIATTRVAAQSAGTGPVVAVGGSTDNFSQGFLGLRSQAQDYNDQDRAGRTYVSLYNEFIVYFEQILETLNGEVLGDRDGKFRFFVGRGRTYSPPGYEDAITGELVDRNVWSEVFFSASNAIKPNRTDIIVDPETATQNPTTLEVDGDFLDPYTFRFYIDEQNKIIQNDMDDLVLVRRRRPKLQLTFPLPTITVLGEYKRMAEPHRLSRLFPELALAFSTTFPGLEANLLLGNTGEYAFLKMLEPPKLFKGEGAVFGSTFRQPIASLSNPSLGVIENVTDASPRERLPRARIWAYSPTGFPDLDSAFGLSTPTAGRPTVIATVLFLKDFPINPETGFPDFSRLASNTTLIDPITGGPAKADLPDLITGDQSLSTPKWQGVDRKEKILPQLAFGRPTGETFGVGQSSNVLGKGLFGGAFDLSQEQYAGIFVEEVQLGSIITFAEENGSPINDASDIVILGAGELEGSPFSVTQGDTIYVIPPGATDTTSLSDPPTIEELQEFSDNLPVYRRGFDVGVQRRGGSFIDTTLPSFQDPSVFGLKEILGQRPPKPLSTIEADVEFTNTDRNPHEFPALLGETTNDDGDYAIPYLGSNNTELDRLSSVAIDFINVQQADSPTPQAVYPDEILDNGGTIITAAVGTTPPATLLATQDLTPVTTAGSYTPNSGIGDTKQFDIAWVQTGQGGVVDGVEGIVQIGAVTASTLEPARFVTQTLKGDLFRYIVTNAMVHINGGGVTGMTAVSAINTPIVGQTTVTLDISSIGGAPFFNDGAGITATGGLNNIVSNGLQPFPNDNLITIEFINPGTGLIVETITLTGTSATGGLGTVTLISAPSFTDKTVTLVFTSGPFIDYTALGGVFPGPSTPHDFALSVNTFNAGAALAGSDTGLVERDRLTFSENFDLSSALPRGTTTVGALPVQCSLRVSRITASGNTDCAVNSVAEINGGANLTFLLRDASATSVGTFTPATSSGAGDEVGSLKAMAFEGHTNTPISTTSPITYATVPSSDENILGTILNGTATIEDGLDALQDISISAGLVSNIEAGDVLVIEDSATSNAAVKSGTYLIRHAIPESGTTSGAHEVIATTVAGSVGWLGINFPKVVSATTGPFELVVNGITTVSGSPSGYDFPSAGTLYIVKSSTDLSTSLTVSYSSFSVSLNGEVTFSLVGGSATDATGGFVSNANFATLVVANDNVSGMLYLPIGIFKGSFPDNNVVGNTTALSTIAGFTDITISNPGGGSNTWSQGTDLVSGTPGVGEIGIEVPPATPSTSFVPSLQTPVYEDVATFVDISEISASDWNTIHGTIGSAILGLIPGDTLVTDDGASTPGFYALAGIFLEPSWPTPVQDLGNGEAKVVDASHSITVGTVGMRSAFPFLGVTSEEVTFEVRRIRRFHTQMDDISNNLEPLRFAYEIREATVSGAGYSKVSLPGLELITLETSGTQLGDLTDPDVNINTGDEIRLLNSTGEVVDTAFIAGVAGNTLLISPPGFTEVTPVLGDTLQIFLKQAPVPHDQSNQQLFELIVSEKLISQTAVPSTGVGGRAPSVNQLEDSGVTDWGALGIQEGDILVVDAAGTLEGPTGPASTPEVGARPFGDQSVLARGPGAPYSAGSPSQLDDNRGWYRVTNVTTTTLEVSGVTEFTGADGSDVVYGASGQEYAVYPTISASGLTGTTEGQMDLRPTAPADGSNSYLGNFNSIEPFNYQIIRPTSLLTDAAIDLILMNRERVKSWQEIISSSVQGTKKGSYFIFQRDEHISNLGSTSDPNAGLGLYSNNLITTLSGLIDTAPFANVSDCLSVLDRRYWILDTKLDREVPPNTGGMVPYSSFIEDSLGAGLQPGSGRPVLPDRIDDVLDRDDRLRQLRIAWIRFRSDRVNGSLFQADRFEEQLPQRLQEQEDLLRLQTSLEDI